ncbi:hypothetical protein PENTCL1PPCAC_6883 [Pristionchus entomophagus]|uniref:DNA helicase n=1 Tax=Pristionchus entomophagus TaxID=358040 RepID=A0AAV5SNK5_9BILA|nr:hypothetical protein PENTCL1PPCAC_6883 [Pristionchus entomophagus]
MSGGEEYDSFDDDHLPNENTLPATSNGKVDGSSSRKRGTAVLKTSQDDNNEDSFDNSISFEDTPKRARLSGSADNSPIKKRSPKKIIDETPVYDENVDGFPSLVDLPLSSNSTRHQHLSVTSIELSDGTTTLHCKTASYDAENTQPCIVYLQGMWHSCEIREGSTIRLIGAKKWSDTEWLVTDEDGMVITQTDVLIPCTTVVNSFFCARKAVLGERLKGGGNSVSKAMLMGIIIHELFQAALLTPPSFHLTKEWLLSRWREVIMDEVIVSMTACNLTTNSFEGELEPYVEVIIEWVNSYMPKKGGIDEKRMEGGAIIREVHDIEENIWMPALGLKGKIDVSLEVDATTHHSPFSHSTQRWLVPLELKTGKSSVSADHAGQVLMYTMMLAHRYSLPIHEGSLLYLKDGTARRVQPRSAELKGIISRRNDVAAFIGAGSTHEKLPVPRPDTHFCQRCDYATACTLYGKAFERREGKEEELTGPSPPPSDEALAFQLQMTKHLTQKHLDYFRKWQRWQSLEWTSSRRDKRPPSDIWEMSASNRELLSPLTTMCNLRVMKCEETGVESGKWNVTLKRTRHQSQLASSHSIYSKGDFVIVSTDEAPAVVMGPVIGVDEYGDTVTIVSDRKLPLEDGGLQKRRKKKCDQLFHLDRHESATVHAIQLNNLVALMSGEERCTRLRSLLIDLDAPSTTKLKSADVSTVKGVVKGLIQGQIAAVVKSLCASDYALIEGLPGSGKTSTLVALVRSIVALGHTVLVTAYTHSAVDNLLAKIAKVLPSSQLLRLGKQSSVHPAVQGLTLESKLADCSSPQEKYDRAKKVLANTPVVAASSLAVATHSLFSWRKFDICIVDESSLVLESSLIGALLSSDRFVLVGDAKQLKPLVQNKQAGEEGMSTSLFERLISAHSNKHAVTLDKQFRMNRVVSSVASSLFYHGRLVCANDKVAESCLNSVHEEYEKKNGEREEGLSSALLVALDGSIDNSAVFIDVPSGNEEGKDETEDSPSSTTVSLSMGGIVNEREAEVVNRLIEELMARGLPTSSIGVAAVYRKQVELLRRSIPTGIEVNTADQWQGRDAEVLICSLAWTRSHGRKRSELLSDEKRINVALTRAKYKMIFIGCARSMRERCPIVSSVIDRVKLEKLQ